MIVARMHSRQSLIQLVDIHVTDIAAIKGLWKHAWKIYKDYE